jgi:hypothetical protein
MTSQRWLFGLWLAAVVGIVALYLVIGATNG